MSTVRMRATVKARRAFTLVEVLIVIAVLAVLVAILLPVTNNARIQARRTVVLSNLRQIGQAMEVYLQDYDSVSGRHATDLVDAKLVPPALLESPFDPIREGLANYHRFISPEMGRKTTPYKDSVLVLDEVVGPSLTRQVAESRGSGWAVSFVDNLPVFNDPLQGESGIFVSAIKGAYYRLGFDGSVVRRSVIEKSRNTSGAFETYTSMTWLYTDEADRFD